MVKTTLFRNNFDLLRILAASQVMVVIFVSPSRLGYRIGLVPMAGSLPGCSCIFSSADFLSPHPWSAASRQPTISPTALRIFPALWVASASPFRCKMFWKRGFSRWETLPWLLGQISFVQFFNPEFLRGYGTGVLNGSLWTITVELQFYLLLPLLYAVPVAQIENDQVLGALLVLFFLLSALLWTLDIPRQTEKWLQVTFLPTFHCSCSAFGYAGGPARIPFIERQSVDLAHRLRLVGKRTRSGCFPLALSRLVLGLLTISSFIPLFGLADNILQRQDLSLWCLYLPHGSRERDR